MLAGHLALVAAAIFFGVAFYVSFAEQAARLGLDDRALLAEWKPAYKRGYAIQAPLAILGFILGIVACWQTGRPSFLAGSLLMIANWPWTIFAVMPTNTVLMATRLDDANAGTRRLIVRWNVLHSVRTLLGGMATVAFLIALSSA
jgi:TRAP-type uncharacterized transport system fused permease subunit